MHSIRARIGRTGIGPLAENKPNASRMVLLLVMTGKYTLEKASVKREKLRILLCCCRMLHLWGVALAIIGGIVSISGSSAAASISMISCGGGGGSLLADKIAREADGEKRWRRGIDRKWEKECFFLDITYIRDQEETRNVTRRH